jgi:cytochrome P450
VISRYDDVLRALRDPALYSSAAGVGYERRPSPDMISTDPPDHTRLRRVANRPFLPRAVAALEPRITAIVDGLIDDLLDQRQADLVSTVAEPLPVIVIAELLGVPTADRPAFKRWSDAVFAVAGGGLDQSTQAAAEADRRDFVDYLRATIKERRSQPSSSPADIIGDLVAGEDAMADNEIISLCVLLLAAGNETTTNAIGNTTLAMINQPDQWRALANDPTLVPAFIEEMVRYDAPIQGLFRDTADEARVAGQHIPAGARALLLFGSANRDDRHYPDADTFLTGRNPTDHLGFGSGIHYCLGAPLARLELTVLLSQTLRRVRWLLPDGLPTRTCSAVARGVRHLPLIAIPR